MIYCVSVYIYNKASYKLILSTISLTYLLFLTNNSSQMRFGKVNKYISNTNVFEHSGKLYSISENHMPQEIDISTLETLGNWVPWNIPFTSHPKVL